MSASAVRAEAVAGIELLELRAIELRPAAGALRGAFDIVVVHQHRHAIPGQVRVGLEDRGALIERAFEGHEGVLRCFTRATPVPDHDGDGRIEVGVRHCAYGIMRRPMAVLTRDAILKELRAGRLRIEPFSEDQLGVASIDLTLGDEIRVIEVGAEPIDVLADCDYRDHTRVRQLTEPYVLEPGVTIHGITLEHIYLPQNLCGFLEGRSRFARLGLMIHVTSAFVQPGVANRQVLEMSNVSSRALEIVAGVRICQLVLMRTEGRAVYRGRFQDQREI